MLATLKSFQQRVAINSVEKEWVGRRERVLEVLKDRTQNSTKDTRREPEVDHTIDPTVDPTVDST